MLPLRSTPRVSSSPLMLIGALIVAFTVLVTLLTGITCVLQNPKFVVFSEPRECHELFADKKIA